MFACVPKCVLDQALDEVLELAIESCRDLNNSPEQSNEWFKHRGEILAYGRVTAALVRIEESQEPKDSRALARHYFPA